MCVYLFMFSRFPNVLCKRSRRNKNKIRIEKKNVRLLFFFTVLHFFTRYRFCCTPSPVRRGRVAEKVTEVNNMSAG